VHTQSGPYTIAYVTLAEGHASSPISWTATIRQIKIDAPAKLVWKPSEGGAPVPFFTLA